jgi:hypothetical protein
MNDDVFVRWQQAVDARAEGARRARERRKRTEAAAFDLACAVSAFIADARRQGLVPACLLDVLTQSLDAYNDARAPSRGEGG